jgi:hypothetical protein
MSPAALVSALGHSWSMTVASMDYRVIGPVSAGAMLEASTTPSPGSS